jgi:NADH:ubiquinone oxidoreductase subunit E
MIKKIGVCSGKTCSNRGAEHIMNELKKHQAELNAPVEFCACTGYCEQGPIVVIDEKNMIQEARVPTIVQAVQQGEYKKIDKITFEDIAQSDILGDLF